MHQPDSGGDLISDVCIPGEGGAGERASSPDESVRRTAHGGVQGGYIQRGRSVLSRRDSTLPGALQLCRTHPCRGGKSFSFQCVCFSVMQKLNGRIDKIILLFFLFFFNVSNM